MINSSVGTSMDKKPEVSAVAKLILDSMGDVKEESLNSPLALALAKSAKQELTKLQVNKDIINPDLDKRLRELKTAEENSDLCWIDYTSWNLLTKPYQDYIINLLNPTFWGGLFFYKSRFTEVESLIWNRLPQELSVYELKDAGNFRLVIVGPDKSIYDWLNVYDFRKERNLFENTVIRSIGMSKFGVVIKNKIRETN